MTYGRSHLLMPRLVASIRIMAHRLASASCGKTEELRMSSPATDFEGHTVD
jgi:hypothetical protein